jgi:hypothetical protein
MTETPEQHQAWEESMVDFFLARYKRKVPAPLLDSPTEVFVRDQVVEVRENSGMTHPLLKLMGELAALLLRDRV